MLARIAHIHSLLELEVDDACSDSSQPFIAGTRGVGACVVVGLLRATENERNSRKLDLETLCVCLCGLSAISLTSSCLCHVTSGVIFCMGAD